MTEQRIAQIEYTSDGEIFSEEEKINYDLNEILNLNEPGLMQRRKNLLKKTKREIRSFKEKVRGNKAKMKVFLENKKPNGKQRRMINSNRSAELPYT